MALRQLFRKHLSTARHLAISDRDGRWRVYSKDRVLFTASRDGEPGADECRMWLRTFEARRATQRLVLFA